MKKKDIYQQRNGNKEISEEEAQGTIMQTFSSSKLLAECFAKGESFVFLIKSPESIAHHGKSSITQKQFSMSKAQNGCSVSCHLLKLRARHLL